MKESWWLKVLVEHLPPNISVTDLVFGDDYVLLTEWLEVLVLSLKVLHNEESQ